MTAQLREQGQPSELPTIRGEWLSERGLNLPAGLTFEHWLEIGEQLKRIEKGVQFWIGDWLNYGEKAYGEKYAQAVLETGKSEGTLANYSYVARRIEPSRRRENVAFGHYQNIAALGQAQQEDALDRIESDDLKVSESRQLVRTGGKSTNPPTLLQRVKDLENIAKGVRRSEAIPANLHQQIDAYEKERGWMT